MSAINLFAVPVIHQHPIAFDLSQIVYIRRPTDDAGRLLVGVERCAPGKRLGELEVHFGGCTPPLFNAFSAKKCDGEFLCQNDRFAAPGRQRS